MRARKRNPYLGQGGLDKRQARRARRRGGRLASLVEQFASHHLDLELTDWQRAVLRQVYSTHPASHPRAVINHPRRR